MGRGYDLKPENWGWMFQGAKFEPKTMDSSQAPESLIKIIICQCKGDCHTKKFSCRKHELDCSTSCSECKGVYSKTCSTDTVDINDINLGVE